MMQSNPQRQAHLWAFIPAQTRRDKVAGWLSQPTLETEKDVVFTKEMSDVLTRDVYVTGHWPKEKKEEKKRFLSIKNLLTFKYQNTDNFSPTNARGKLSKNSCPDTFLDVILQIRSSPTDCFVWGHAKGKEKLNKVKQCMLSFAPCWLHERLWSGGKILSLLIMWNDLKDFMSSLELEKMRFSLQQSSKNFFRRCGAPSNKHARPWKGWIDPWVQLSYAAHLLNCSFSIFWQIPGSDMGGFISFFLHLSCLFSSFFEILLHAISTFARATTSATTHYVLLFNNVNWLYWKSFIKRSWIKKKKASICEFLLHTLKKRIYFIVK